MFALVGEVDPLLVTPCEEFDFATPPFDPIEFAKELVKLMRDLNGIGLAANQVGQPYRVFAMRSDPNKVMFNPKIVWESEEIVMLEEGCLSFPGLFVKIKRPKHIRMRYTQPNGEVITEVYTGMSARVVQHEIDHLDGVLFYNRANRYHRELAFNQRKKNLKKALGTAYTKAKEIPGTSPTALPTYETAPVANDFFIIPPITTDEGLRGDV